MKILPFAWRNIGRNRDRTIVTIGAMAFAGAIMIFYVSLIEGMVEGLERNMIGMNLGDIQIHAKGYRDDPDLYNRISGVDHLITKLDELGFNVAPRLYGFGLAAAGAASSGVSIRGVNIEREATVTSIANHVARGLWLDSSDIMGAVIGAKLSRTLGAGVGDEIIIVGQASDGSMANDIFMVRGVLKPVGEGIDRSGFLITESAFREFFVIPDGYHELALVRRDRSIPLGIATQKTKGAAEKLDVKNWRELQPVMARMLDIADAGNLIMLLIVYAAIGMVTLNAMLMSVFERIKEFGIMKAVGVSPLQIMALILAEAGIQTLIACTLALGAGGGLSWHYQYKGLDISFISGKAFEGSLAGVALDAVWYPHLSASSALQPVAVLAIVVSLAVIYPGVKAAVIQPVKAIHHI